MNSFVPDPIVKIVFIGDTNVGKSSIFLSFADNTYQSDYVATIGVDFRFKRIQVGDQRIKLQLWDTAGQERFRSITKSYYKGSDIICLIYDITNYESFRNLQFWMEEVRKSDHIPTKIVLIGNKCDLHHHRMVSQEKVGGFAEKIGATMFEVSAKTHMNLDDAFQEMAKQVLETRKSKIVQEEKTIKLHSETPMTKRSRWCF